MGIIADKVGSGKSFVVLSIVINNAFPTENEPVIRTYGQSKIVIWQRDAMRSIGTNLLVIPHNLVRQWEDYIKAFSSTLKYLMVTKNRTIDMMMDATENSVHDVQNYDLLVVTSTFYNRLALLLTARSFKLRRVVFDEIDNMHIPGCVHIDAHFYWFVTASFGNLLYPRGYSRWDPNTRRHVQNAVGLRNAGFVKMLFSELHTHVSNDYTRVLVVRNHDSYVQESINLPVINNVVVRCRTPTTISVLHGLVDKNIIGFLNAGDVASAIQHINPQNRKTEDGIISLLIDRYARQMKNMDVRIEYTRHYEYENEQDKIAELNRLIDKRKELENKVESIKNRIIGSDICSVCYDNIQNKTIVPCCSNSYCFQCISRWLCRNSTCPLCKGNVGINNVLVVDGTETNGGGAGTSASAAAADHTNELHESNDKMKNLENILKTLGRNCKVLIFSSYDNSFSNAATVMQELNLNHAMLKGNSGQINNIVERYKRGDLNVLLVNARQYGAGLNLENTQHIIMFHKFDNEIEHQIIGRAHRYGRTDPLKVWYLLHENEETT